MCYDYYQAHSFYFAYTYSRPTNCEQLLRVSVLSWQECWYKGSKQVDQFVFKKQKSWRIGETWEKITSFVSFIKSPKHMNPWLEAEKSLEY